MTKRAEIREQFQAAVSHTAARSQKGFTLLEVLVATAIMGMAVAALLSLLSGSLGNLQRLEAPEQALLLGQSQLNELLAPAAEASNGAGAGMPLGQRIAGRWDEQFRWEAIATRHRSSPEPAPGETILVRIALDIFWGSGLGKPEKKLSFETYQLWKEPGRIAQ